MTSIPVALDPPSLVTVEAAGFDALNVTEPRAAVVADPAAWDRHGPGLLARFSELGVPVEVLPVASGEACKTIEEYGRVLGRLASMGFTRDTAVVSLGGGATSDLAGFVAGTFLRGVAFYTLPTTLLGMVDAAVGGKTAVDLPEGKNLAGVFHQPRQAHANLATLATLPGAVFRQGAAELFKHGLLADPALCRAVLKPGFGPADPDLEATVAAGIAVKARAVERDPREAGERAYLNFGHTLAHALEAFTGHALAHGEAVAYGMHYAALLGRSLGLADVTAETRAFLAYQRPGAFGQPRFEDLAVFMGRDKKTDARGWRFVLFEGPQRPALFRVTPEQAAAVWPEFLSDVRALA
ncbi:MAG TPA: 3-dehydroquinate synthase family protein [Deinococcales bacterium]|nr:3-dehydroquinate synthase family protein [Deinococcales bacterium]